MINALGWVMLSAGALTSLHPVLRTFAVRRAISRLEQSAWALYSQAVERNKGADPFIIDLHDSIIELAMHAPFIGSGLVDLRQRGSSGNPDPERLKQIEEFLDANGWVKPYIQTVSCCLQVLEMLGKPYRLVETVKGLRCVWMLKYRADKDGGLTILEKSDRTSVVAEDIRRTANDDIFLGGRKLIPC